MHAEYDFTDDVILITGACGALGSAIAETFAEAGATACGTDIIPPDDDNAQIDPDAIQYYQGDFTNETDVESVISDVIADHDKLTGLCNIAGTWKGGTPIENTDVNTFDMLFNVNLKTMFLASKHAIPHLRDTNGAIVSVSARSSLEGGEGDGPYRASKAGVRLLTETIAEENTGDLRANAIMPSVIDTPMNREMMPDADHSTWVDPYDIADVVLFLCSNEAGVTSGAAVPVYGEA